jgi:hypothetical protein
MLLSEFATIIEEELFAGFDIPQCDKLDPMLAVDEGNLCSAVEAIPFADSMIDKSCFVSQFGSIDDRDTVQIEKKRD